jgi:hypothetical protein
MVYIFIYHRVNHRVHLSDRIRVDIGDIRLVLNNGSDVFYSGTRWAYLFKTKRQGLSGSGH